MKSLEGLNDRQKEAVLATEGPVLIVAGAGAGKTRTLVARMTHLIEKGVAPEAILGITFTNKASGEMRERVSALVPNEVAGRAPLVSTFHSLSVKIIRAEHGAVGLPKYFSILDDADTYARLRQAARDQGYDPKEIPLDSVRSTISREKRKMSSPDELLDNARKANDNVAAEIWRRYEETNRADGALDFDDLLLFAVRILSRPDIRERYHRRFKYIHVDEYQDTSDIEYELVRLITGAENNICVVGDTDQNIYGWRGANIENIMRFERDFPGAQIILLEENYLPQKH